MPDLAAAPLVEGGDGASEDVGSINILNEPHCQTLERAVRRILDTDVAEETYAQILDGLPTTESLHCFMGRQPRHLVVMLNHEHICPGVLEKTREFKEGFQTSSLRFSLPLLFAFQDAEAGTKAFHLRLIELVAVACHQIAVYLYNLDDGPHKHAEYEEWRQSPRDKTVEPRRPPVAFCHNYYVAISQYPNGPADCAGYWAEAKIFGGVVIFDRGESEKECRDVFLHGSIDDGPETIYAPTQEQLENLILFLESPDDATASEACPLPMNATFYNRYRWDSWDAMARFHIFRDRYERKIPASKPQRPFSCTGGEIDYPEWQDEIILLNNLYQEAAGNPVNKTEMDQMRLRLRQITPSSPHSTPEAPWRGVTYGLAEGDEDIGVSFPAFDKRKKAKKT